MVERENSLNIWGEPGCQLPEGKGICTACCTSLEVPEIGKKAGQECPYSTPKQGCELHNRPEKPKSCRDYHCSQEKENSKNGHNRILWIAYLALLRGEIEKKHQEEVIKRFPPKDISNLI